MEKGYPVVPYPWSTAQSIMGIIAIAAASREKKLEREKERKRGQKGERENSSQVSL